MPAKTMSGSDEEADRVPLLIAAFAIPSYDGGRDGQAGQEANTQPPEPRFKKVRRRLRLPPPFEELSWR